MVEVASGPTLCGHPLTQLDAARRTLSPGARLEATLRGAPRLEAAIAESGTPRVVRTLEISTFPYPTRYAFAEACSVPVPYVWLFNRALLVEYVDGDGAVRRLLVNPTHPESARRTPYFESLLTSVPGPLRGAFERSVRHRAPPLLDQLRTLGVPPESIDFITFDHLHTQHVGVHLGPEGHFPAAKLLVTHAELSAARSLHPLQRYWYLPDGLAGVSAERIVAFDADLLLGQGVALVRTPGHTAGNHSIVLNLPGGLVTISENGVAPECYAPRASRIPGLAQHAERMGIDMILNANTREGTLDQYTSMCLEAALAAPVDGGPFPRCFASSELVHSPLAPGVRPTHTWSAFTYGLLAHPDE